MYIRFFKYLIIIFVILQFVIRPKGINSNNTSYLVGFVVAQLLISCLISFVIVKLKKKD
jgi:hypothetical protein